jgi:hypothetical protein
MRSPRFDGAFNKLAAAEQRFLASKFLAPALGSGQVQVRIAGVIQRLRVSPLDFRGFGVFQPTSPTAAVLVRPATLAQRREYLALFPLVRLILCKRDGHDWLAIPAHQGDARIRIAGPAPLRMVEEAQQFDVVRARFDGTSFWLTPVAIRPRRRTSGDNSKRKPSRISLIVRVSLPRSGWPIRFV